MRRLVEGGAPVIAFLWTGALKHWPAAEGVDYLHAAVVVGFTEAGILLNDPKLPDGPTEIPVADLVEAWKLADHLVAYIRRQAWRVAFARFSSSHSLRTTPPPSPPPA